MSVRDNIEMRVFLSPSVQSKPRA